MHTFFLETLYSADLKVLFGNVLHCELFKDDKLSERVKKSRKIGTQLGIEPRTF